MIYLACVILCFNVFFQCSVTVGEKEIDVTIEDSQTIATVDERFHGVAFDASLFTPKGLYSFVNITSQKLINLLKGLSPGYFRVGGTFANWLFFELKDNSDWLTDWAFDNETQAKRQKDTKGWLFRKPNNMSKQIFDQLVNLTKKGEMRLLFDLNAEIRNNADYDEWDQSEAIKLFDYCVEKKYFNHIDWELGNEPNHISAHNLTEEQVGNDFLKLHKLLYESDQYKELSKGSKFVGPDVGWMGVSYIGGLANISGNKVSAFTIHQYYFDGKTANETTYINASYFYNLQKLFDKVKKELESSSKKNEVKDTPLWLGETSAGYNSGTVNVSDTYVSGFLWLDKLGLSAANNIQVVIRQTIYNGHYGLLNKTTLDPYPDYWLTYVHNKLVGKKVFKVKVEDSSNQTRVYAQCTKTSDENEETKYTKGSLTIFALNVNEESVKLKFKNSKYDNGPYDPYVLTPAADDGDVLSRKVKLNDKLLEMNKNQLPSLKTYNTKSDSTSSIILKGKTFGFFVFPKADIDACK